MKINYAKAFTLIELVLTLAIMMILSSIAYPAYKDYLDRAKIATSIADIMKLDLQIARFYATGANYPSSLADLGSIPLDPWDNPYQYLNIQTMKGKGSARKDKSLVPINSDYDLYSMGKDGRSVSPLTAKHSRDDIVRGNNGGFVGLATDY